MNGKNLKSLKSIVMIAACIAAIFIFSAQSRTESQNLTVGLLENVNAYLNVQISPLSHEAIYITRKLAHFTEFFVLGSVAFYVLRRYSWALLLGIGSAIADEVHQMFVPGRTPQVMDVMIDSAGVAFALLCIYIFFRVREVMKGKATARFGRGADAA